MRDLTQTLLMLGLGIGALLFTPMADKFGRKPLNVFVHIACLLLGIGISFAPNYTVYAIMRFLIGTTLSVRDANDNSMYHIEQGYSLPIII